jgi:hypothetical protein
VCYRELSEKIRAEIISVPFETYNVDGSEEKATENVPLCPSEVYATLSSLSRGNLLAFKLYCYYNRKWIALKLEENREKCTPCTASLSTSSGVTQSVQTDIEALKKPELNSHSPTHPDLVQELAGCKKRTMELDTKINEPSSENKSAKEQIERLVKELQAQQDSIISHAEYKRLQVDGSIERIKRITKHIANHLISIKSLSQSEIASYPEDEHLWIETALSSIAKWISHTHHELPSSDEADKELHENRNNLDVMISMTKEHSVVPKTVSNSIDVQENHDNQSLDYQTIAGSNPIARTTSSEEINVSSIPSVDMSSKDPCSRKNQDSPQKKSSELLSRTKSVFVSPTFISPVKLKPSERDCVFHGKNDAPTTSVAVSLNRFSVPRVLSYDEDKRASGNSSSHASPVKSGFPVSL